ncbi:uncharacterized protein LOC126733317 [Quercus robur]|uniref:uncharacterized protein LOC126733317 n=1 Tax=Quercus robur TaxID=38942 RepID=UPI002163882F|nr:uncharacterized protein LOC126733317 [Quercus robur]XP_050292514.1 uncharacterized protein LOC126733317 [Quercus robur]
MTVILHESMGVDIPNIKLLKKEAKKFHMNLSKFHCENDDLIVKLNESNKLVEKYKKLAENFLEKLKEFECLNMDLVAKLVLSNKLVDDLKCENESLKMYAKCLITESIAKNDENICCNHVVVSDFVPIVCFTSKDKSVYILPHKRNQKVERKALKPKPLFRSQPEVLDGSKFVPTCHHCGVIGYIRPQCPKLREQNHIARSFPKKSSGPKHIIYNHCGVFDHLIRLYCSKFQAFKQIKRKEKLELLGSCAMKVKPDLGETGKLLKKVFDVLTSLSMCISGSHSSNPRITSYETLIPKNCFVWMRKDSYG